MLKVAIIAVIVAVTSLIRVALLIVGTVIHDLDSNLIFVVLFFVSCEIIPSLGIIWVLRKPPAPRELSNFSAGYSKVNMNSSQNYHNDRDREPYSQPGIN
jgi:hypothetical protein